MPSWYPREAVVGRDPFSHGELTDKVRFVPTWGSDSHSGILEPSSGGHHRNDYFSEGYPERTTLETRLRNKQRSKNHKKRLNKNWYDKDSQLTQELDAIGSIGAIEKSTVTIRIYSNKQGEVGAGFFIGPNLILTCNHVVTINNKEPNELIIKYNNKDYKGNIIVTNPQLDVAVIKIDDTEVQSTPHLRLGDSTSLKLGEPVIALGTPLGFENIASEGIISSKPIEVGEITGGSEIYMFVSSSLLPGSSGGPVALSSDSSIVGIAAAIIGGGEQVGGLNAVIPINVIKNWLEQNQIPYN